MEKSNTKKTKVDPIQPELTEEQLLKAFALKFAHLFQLEYEYYTFHSPIGLIRVNEVNHCLLFDKAVFQLTPEEFTNFLETRFKLQIDFLKKA